MSAVSGAVLAPPRSRARARTDRSPWYRQFWPWFLIALPAVSIVFSFATLFVALRGADTVVPHEGDSTSYSAPRAPARTKEMRVDDGAPTSARPTEPEGKAR